MKSSGSLILFLWISLSSALTENDYETIRDAFITKVRSDRTLQPTIVRLSFHDCVSGCDGCINLDNAANNGLSDAIDFVEELYTEITDAGISVSRADLWAIGGRAAAEFGMENMPGNSGWVKGVSSMNDFVTPFATFKYGRVDCETAPYTTEEYAFPEPHMNNEELMDYFAENMGMTADQTAAIMGAHTLGNMAKENSGYSGPWLNDPADVLQHRTSFDNEYYRSMLNSDYTFTGRNRAGRQSLGEDARPQYGCTDPDGTACGNMINTDWEVLYNMPLNEDNFLSECDLSAATTDCEKSDTYDLSVSYSEDNDKWLEDYVSAYDVMTANGASSLTEISS